MKRFAVLGFAVALAMCSLLVAQGPDDSFIRIFDLIQQGDTLYQAGRLGEAEGRYLEAEAALKELKRQFPYWNPQVVDYRLNYLARRLGAKSGSIPPSARAVKESEVVPEQDAKDMRIAALDQQIQALATERDALRAKLREALSVQPAAVDPREVARAEQRVRQLEEENRTLRALLTEARAETRVEAARPSGGDALKRAEKDLEKAKERMAKQERTIDSLSKEKTALEASLKKAGGGARTARKLEDSEQLLKEANRELSKQESQVKTLAREKRELEKQLRRQSEGRDADAGESQRRVLDLEKQLAAERGRAEALANRNEALESRLAQASPAGPEAPPPTAPVAAPLTRQEKRTIRTEVKALERERNQLRKRVASLSRELEDRKARSGDMQQEFLADQLKILRARIAVYEARAVPYSPEEISLLQQSARAVDQTPPSTARKTSREIPPAAMKLVAEAQRAFQSGRLEEAERNYAEALKLDPENLALLTDLAATQIERDRLREAEQTLNRAYAHDAADPTVLSLMGLMRFKEGKYEEAVDALSQSALVDPDNAVTQNYLGIALSQKGLRKPAETALRKAVQLQPGYAEAHNNLAVVYATQEPPYISLARWHYRKALDGGHPRSPELDRLLEQPGANGVSN